MKYTLYVLYLIIFFNAYTVLHSFINWFLHTFLHTLIMSLKLKKNNNMYINSAEYIKLCIHTTLCKWEIRTILYNNENMWSKDVIKKCVNTFVLHWVQY